RSRLASVRTRLALWWDEFFLRTPRITTRRRTTAVLTHDGCQLSDRILEAATVVCELSRITHSATTLEERSGLNGARPRSARLRIRARSSCCSSAVYAARGGGVPAHR